MKRLFLLLLLLLCACQIGMNSDVVEIEQAILREVNTVRLNNGLKQLVYNERYSEIARAHSQDMVERDYPENNNSAIPLERLKKANLSYSEVISENFYQEKGLADLEASKIAKKIVESWLSMQGPRENLLGKKWRMTGIGVAFSNNPEENRYRIVVTEIYFMKQDMVEYMEKTLQEIEEIDRNREALLWNILQAEKPPQRYPQSKGAPQSYTLTAQYQQLNGRRATIIYNYEDYIRHNQERQYMDENRP